MTMLSSLELIRRVPLFSMLTDAQAVSVADAVVKRRFKRGEVIVEQGKKTKTGIGIGIVAAIGLGAFMFAKRKKRKAA